VTLRLHAYNDAALESLAPKGLVRRARRDFEAGLASVVASDGASAQVRTDGHTVTLGERGPAAAQCTCGAVGICRHILLAVMAVNHDAPETASDKQAMQSAAEEICNLKESDLVAFAGASWSSAVALAAASGDAAIAKNNGNCIVELAGAPGGVTFIAGQGLKGAGVKEPKSRARTIVTAAAILVRAKQGILLEKGDDRQSGPHALIDGAFLNDAAEKLVQAIPAVLSSASPIAADLLFDLAISTRANAAPRLTAMLRSLAKQAWQAGTRDVHFHADEFLNDAARTYALIEALKRNADDPVLTGTLRRDYRPSPPFDLWMLGAAIWRTDTGARGLTLHGFAPEEHVWRSVSIARGAGMDPSFSPRAAYDGPLWSAGPARSLIGKALRLPEALVAEDEVIAPSLPQPAVVRSSVGNLRSLIECRAAALDWQELRRNVAARLGDGLRRRSSGVPALLAPSKYGSPFFNDFAQTYEWEALDQSGGCILFTLPGVEHEFSRQLAGLSASPHLVLAETVEASGRAALRPLTILFDGADGIEAVNLTLDDWPKSRPAASRQALSARRLQSTNDFSRPILTLAQRVIGTAISILTGGLAAEVGQLGQACEAAGLVELANAVERMCTRKDPRSALAAVYLASEAGTGLRWL
jgi:hypothetical protein